MLFCNCHFQQLPTRHLNRMGAVQLLFLQSVVTVPFYKAAPPHQWLVVLEVFLGGWLPIFVNRLNIGQHQKHIQFQQSLLIIYWLFLYLCCNCHNVHAYRLLGSEDLNGNKSVTIVISSILSTKCIIVCVQLISLMTKWTKRLLLTGNEIRFHCRGNPPKTTPQA